MGLPAYITSLDDVPEPLHEFYTKSGDGYRLDAEGVEDVSGLKQTLEKEKRLAQKARKKAKELSVWEDLGDLDPDEVREAIKMRDEAAEAAAHAKGDWEELRQKLEVKHQKADAEKDARVAMLQNALRRTVVSDALNVAISDVGVLDEYRKAARLELMDRKPEMVEDGEEFRAVFRDEMGDTVPLSEFVKTWAKTDEASIYMPGTGVSGGGAESSKTTQRGGVRVLPNDPEVIGRNLEDIAAGKARVDMSPRSTG